ncbi:MAG TPA: amidohydrolase, partial [Anaerolineae bacterium]|nr:amidohydrolase [Anaerolineae bacterium]
MTPKADFIVENARIFTSNPEMPQAESVAVKGNRIIYVGTNDGGKDFKDQNTRVIDGQGRTLTPGFIDSHFHLLWGAISMGGAQLYDAKDINDVRTILLEFAENNKTAEWIDGRGVRYDVIANRHELDAIIADKPIYINAYDGHTSWANTRALELAGILQPGKEAEGNGVIVRDENGIATGELRETAMGLVSDLIPE